MSQRHVGANDSCQHLDHVIKVVEPLLSGGLSLLSWSQLLFLVVALKDSVEPVPPGLQHAAGSGPGASSQNLCFPRVVQVIERRRNFWRSTPVLQQIQLPV